MATTSTIPQINVTAREQLGKRETRRLRESSRIPAVIYGHKLDPVHTSVDARELKDLMHGHAHLIEVVLGGKAEACLIKEVQWDHMSRNVIHVDFARVDLNEIVSVEIELNFVGEAIGLKEAGAILEHPITTLEVQCKASEIPETITVDVSGLAVDDTLTVGDIKLPEGVTTEVEPDTVVASVHVMAEQEEEPVADDAAAEPEVIGKKDEDEDEEKDAKK